MHLAQKAYVGGPVHYLRMYPFEQFFHRQKQKANNRSPLESLMVMSYVIYKIKLFRSRYFDPKLPTMIPTISRNKVRHANRTPLAFTVFYMEGSPFGRGRKRHLIQEEYKVVHLHILLNCGEVQPYLQ